MKKAQVKHPEVGVLRQRAEQKLRTEQRAAEQRLSEAQVRALVHELQVHQIELEMQNEELHRAQARVQQAADEYAELFDFAPIGCFVIDPMGVISEVNLLGAALLGLDRRSATGQSFELYVVPDSRAAFREFCRGLRSDGGRRSCEVQLLQRHEPCSVLIEGTVTEDESSRSRGCRLAVTDITERKAAEQKLRQFNIELEQRVAARTAELKAANDALRASRVAALNLAEDAVEAREREKSVSVQLRESERQFRTLADSIPNLAWCANGDGYITWYNRRWYEYTGTTPEQMEGWGWQSVHDPEMLSKVLEQWRRSIATGEPFEMEFPLRGGADGRFRWFLTRSLPVKDAGGQVVRWFGTNTDVTEQREAGEAIRRGEALLTQAVQVAGLGIFEHDHRSDRIECSPFMRELLGLGNDEEITVAAFLQRIVPEDRVAVAEAFQRAHDPAGDGVFSLDYRTARADGRVCWLSTRAQTFFEGEGSGRRPFRTVGAAVDVTEHREFTARLERAVAKRTAELRDTNEQLETFVYSIAHDLRSPLRSMTGFSQLLLDDYAAGLGETGQRFLKRIQASSEFMDKLLLDLLAFGRTARIEMELGRVAVQKAWDAALVQCATQVEHHQALVEAADPLPAVRAHEATLTQCLANLLSNALKFVALGVRPSIRFRAEDCGSWVRLWLEDNGIGIPAEQHERVFRVFERLHGARYPGTGIGLSIVRKGAERMGGKVGLESEPGKGSRFWIELPKGD